MRPALPFFLVVVGATLLTTSWLQPFTPAACAAYGLGTLAEAVRVGRKAGATAIPVVWAIFPVVHVAHGVGFGAGLLHYLRKPDWRPEGDERLPKRPWAGYCPTPRTITIGVFRMISTSVRR